MDFCRIFEYERIIFGAGGDIEDILNESNSSHNHQAIILHGSTPAEVRSHGETLSHCHQRQSSTVKFWVRSF